MTEYSGVHSEGCDSVVRSLYCCEIPNFKIFSAKGSVSVGWSNYTFWSCLIYAVFVDGPLQRILRMPCSRLCNEEQRKFDASWFFLVLQKSQWPLCEIHIPMAYVERRLDTIIHSHHRRNAS